LKKEMTSMEIKMDVIQSHRKREIPKDASKLGFGRIFSDHLFMMNYKEGIGWHDARIVPYQPIPLDPAALVLHYAQQVFEGMKAFCGKDGGIYAFRWRDNFIRMNNSARRLCMPEIDVDFAIESLKRLILLDRDWIPRSTGASLYIRPVMLATEPALGVRISNEYLYYVVTGPVGPYYPEGFNPTKIYVTDEYVRAVRGGVGNVKTAGNYAASLLATRKAQEMGFTQVLWLDAIERRFVEEVGTSNMFFVIRDEVVTPALTGGILAGITRDTTIKLCKAWGLNVVERQISIDEVVEGARNGDLKEMFATGTAAVISPVGEFFYKGETYRVADGKTGELSKRLYDEITAMEYGEKKEEFGWVVRID
jgi:branched-chain amino acid aminotransferase